MTTKSTNRTRLSAEFGQLLSQTLHARQKVAAQISPRLNQGPAETMGGCESAKRWEPIRLLLSEYCMLGMVFLRTNQRALTMAYWPVELSAAAFTAFEKKNVQKSATGREFSQSELSMTKRNSDLHVCMKFSGGNGIFRLFDSFKNFKF